MRLIKLFHQLHYPLSLRLALLGTELPVGGKLVLGCELPVGVKLALRAEILVPSPLRAKLLLDGKLALHAELSFTASFPSTLISLPRRACPPR